MINGIIYDKRALARNEPTAITDADKPSTSELWAALEEIAKKKARERGEPVDDDDYGGPASPPDRGKSSTDR